MNPVETALLLGSLCAILPFGILTSIEDIMKNRIRNRWVIYALAFALALSAGTVVFLLVNGSGAVAGTYAIQFAANIGAAFVFGIVLWESSLWSAGDAKLYAAYAALVPLTIYQYGYVPYFPSYVILINTFTPYFLFYVFFILLRTPLRALGGMVSEVFNPTFIGSCVLFLFGFSWILSLLGRFAGIQLNQVLSFALLLLIMLAFGKVRVSLLIVSAALSVARLVVDRDVVFTVPFLQGFAVTIGVFVVLVYFVLTMGFRYFSREMYIENLSEGMILAEDVYEDQKTGEYKKRKLMSISFVSALFDRFTSRSVVERLPEGLSPADVAEIKRLHSEGKLAAHTILVQETLPFAPFMFAGVILTIVSQGNALIALRALLGI